MLNSALALVCLSPLSQSDHVFMLFVLPVALKVVMTIIELARLELSSFSLSSVNQAQFRYLREFVRTSNGFRPNGSRPTV